MIRCILVDDEMNALEMMEWLLKTYCPQVEIAGMYSSAEAAIAAIRQLRPDVVFLDIEMPRMNGFMMLEEFDQVHFDVVFCTAYDQFALKAFRYSALNYLLKPVDPVDLQTTVHRIEKLKFTPSREQFELLLQHLQRPAKPGALRIALTTGDGLLFVNTQDIIFCEADSNYTKVHLSDGKKVLVSKVLKELDEALNGPDFCRVHSSYLVNIHHIKKLVRGEGGYLIMNNESHVPLSRSRRQEFLELFSKF